MNNILKRIIFGYLIAFALVTGYVMCTLWMAQPKDGPQTAATTASSQQNGGQAKGAESSGSPNPSTPPPPECATHDSLYITELIPGEMVMGGNDTSLIVRGCHFKTDSKLTKARTVMFNGDLRTATTKDDNEIVADLHASDFAAARPIKVTVETDAAPPAQPATTGQTAPTSPTTQTPAKVQSNIMILQIKNSVDILVSWHPWPVRCFPIPLELRLILLILFTGAFSGAIGSLKSFVDYAGDCRLLPSWFLYYIAGPFIGSGIALVFYFVIRGGLLAGTNVDTKFVNPYGMVAAAALVGMFWDAASVKLNEVFQSLFQAKDDKRTGTIDGLGICPDTAHDGQVGQLYNPQIYFQASGGTGPYTWAATGLPDGMTLDPNTGVLGGTPTAHGPATVKITVTDHTNKTGTRQITFTINP